jgi:O-acetyl-ADP-ribose deacetylase (regulator of RNase III)
MVAIDVVLGDITEQDVDAIVTAANPCWVAAE